jgi:hypothetical protein
MIRVLILSAAAVALLCVPGTRTLRRMQRERERQRWLQEARNRRAERDPLHWRG